MKTFEVLVGFDFEIKVMIASNSTWLYHCTLTTWFSDVKNRTVYYYRNGSVDCGILLQLTTTVGSVEIFVS